MLIRWRRGKRARGIACKKIYMYACTFVTYVKGTFDNHSNFHFLTHFSYTRYQGLIPGWSIWCLWRSSCFLAFLFIVFCFLNCQNTSCILHLLSDVIVTPINLPRRQRCSNATYMYFMCTEDTTPLSKARRVSGCTPR